MSLDDEWEGVSVVAAPQEETLVGGGEEASSDFGKTTSSSSSDPSSQEGLSLVVKLALAGAIFAACFAWVKARSSSSGKAGRQGVYEKVGV